MAKGFPMTQFVRSPKQLGALIHNARVSRNLTQQALADLVGTGQKTISRIEGGHAGTKLETLFGLIAALDLDLQLGPRAKGGPDLGEIF
jgi:HTH-type transcriptional regulator / antitoxin HipB